MRKHRTSGIRLTVSLSILILLAAAGSLCARVTTPQEAHLVVAGWLSGNVEPFGMPLGRDIVDVETFTGVAGEPIYYIVRLSRAGSVIVSADDLVEPILGFGEGQEYEPSADDPLTALVTSDVTGRMAEAYSQPTGQLQTQSVTTAQAKWHDLIDRASRPGSELGIAGVQTISDVRVPPLLKTHWAQGSVCADYCYNYYTPNHYLAGCVATAMAQVIYYHRHPATGVGRRSFLFSITGDNQTAYTRGGDGAGGPYRWDDMALSPGCSTTETQRQAIGALCYDAGLAVRMEYGPKVSLADAFSVAPKLSSVFRFSNAVNGASNGKNLGTSLMTMINPNLDAEYPVILTITGSGGHAVVADGYGYDLSASTRTLYHHLNMGWGGSGDIWYNLPHVDKYDTVAACAYNLFPEGEGEIVSGRVTDASGRPVAGAAVRATSPTGVYEATTNARGIYALAKLPSASTFAIEVHKAGLSFPRQTVATGTSLDWKTSAGNKWGVDFGGASIVDSDPEARVDFTDFVLLARGPWDYFDLAAFAAVWLTDVDAASIAPVELPVLEN